MRFIRSLRLPSSQQVIARLQAADRAAYRWLLAAAGALRVGRSAAFCGGYGLGLAAMAVGAGEARALPWLAIAGCLFAAGLAHDNERGSAVSALPPAEDPAGEPEPSEPPTRRESGQFRQAIALPSAEVR